MNKYIAGVSGGPDSMALLDLYKNEIAVVCHVNYNKRQSAKRDFSIVKNYCKSNKIRFECLSVTKKICDKYQNFSKNFQNIARRIRYDFFKTIGKKNKINKVLIAHNLNDFVETAYMQSQRKSDSLYLGIKKENFINDLYIFRPLLSKYKSELTKYCDEHNIKYGLDETNELDIYERNRVRKVINKWDKKQFAQFINKIKSFNKKNENKSQKVDHFFNQWKIKKYNTLTFEKISSPLKKYVLYKWMVTNNINNISNNKIVLLKSFIANNNNKNKILRLSNQQFIIKKENCIKLVLKQ